MKAYEVRKDDCAKRGRIIMAVEGPELAVEAIVSVLDNAGYLSTKCNDAGDSDGEVIEYFVINRSDKSDFMRTYKTSKKDRK